VHNDTTILLVLGSAVALLTVAMDLLDRRRIWPQWLCRKVLHVGAVGSCAVAPLLLHDLGALTLIVGAAEALLLAAVAGGRLFREASGRPGWGIALFPLPYLALLLCFPDAPDRWLIALPMAIMAFSDAAAAVVGIQLRSTPFQLTADRKSVAGSSAFTLTTTALLLAWPSPLAALPLPTLLAAAVLLSLLLAAAEALGSAGWDNVWVPGLAAAMLVAMDSGEALHHLASAWGCAAIAVPFAWAAVRRGWLSLGGAVTAAALGCCVVWAQGPAWLLPLLLFFATSTLLGRWSRRSRAVSDAKHGRPRDAAQVMSNGGIYLLAALLLPASSAHWAMAVGMAVAIADTWASEIGLAFQGPTLDLRTGRVVAPGLSGGISLAGTAGALAGALLMGFAAALLLEASAATGLLIAGWGIAGMLVDSLLGAWLQVRYRTANGRWQDRPVPGATGQRGLAWVTNDRVNLLSILLTVVLALLMRHVGW
jgi:uncharacterized protein (TIGR00297 family)